jgi:hypothetical protein
MPKTHWKKLTNPDYLGAYALEDGKDVVLTINHVREEVVTGTGGKKDNCVVCHFAENVKPMILNATNMKTITSLLGTPYIEDWSGKKIQIGIEKVKYAGDLVDALRVRKFLPAVKAFKCESCGKNIMARGNMDAAGMAKYTKQKYGKALCADCATQIAAQMKAAESAEQPQEEAENANK